MTVRREHSLSIWIAGAALGLLSAPALWSATIYVDADCDLGNAIHAANHDATGYANCETGSGDDTIVLTEDVELWTISEMADGPNGLPSVTSTITIMGRSHKIDRHLSGAADFRIFHVAPGARLNLHDVAVKDGLGVPNGGLVYNRGQLRVTDGSLRSGEAQDDGGGIYNLGTVFLTDTWLFSNDAVDGVGGAIANGAEDDCTSGFCYVSLNRVAVDNNTGASGGGIYNGLGRVDSIHASLLYNRAVDRGGGIQNLGTLNLQGSSLGSNEVRVSAGEPPTGPGGGLHNESSGVVNFANSTICDNDAKFGGGIYNKGTVVLDSSTVADNTATGGVTAFHEIDIFGGSTTTLTRSIVYNADSSAACDAAVSADEYSFGCGRSEVTGLGSSCFYNGGVAWVWTLPLEDGSNAIDAGGTCVRLTDQRAIPRGDPCDSGAYEFGDCEDVVLWNEDIDGPSPTVLESCEYVWVSSVDVLSGGHLILRAGLRVEFSNFFEVEEGGELTVEMIP